jgi:DNA-binding response OmpR family regulator
MLPGRAGEDVCRALRKDDDWTPILVVTARPADQAEVEMLDLGADAFVSKPFAFETLVAHARAVLRRGAASDGDERRVGSLRVDTRRRRVHRGDEEIRLTARQFDVLEFLVRRADQVVSKEEILRGVWSFDFNGDPNIVEVYVRRLRERIDEPFGTRTIETVRGAGYRVVAEAE